MFADYAYEHGVNSVRVKGRSNRTAFYSSIQAVLGKCTCKYDYAGTAKHKVVSLPNEQCRVLEETLDWLQAHDGPDQQFFFNEVIANMYMHESKEWKQGGSGVWGGPSKQRIQSKKSKL